MTVFFSGKNVGSKGAAPFKSLPPVTPQMKFTMHADILTEVYAIASLGTAGASLSVVNCALHLPPWLLHCPPRPRSLPHAPVLAFL